MTHRLTVGAQSLLAQKDNTKHDPYEIGEALCSDLLQQVWQCIDAHYDVIDEPEFCVVCLIGTDCLIKGIKRRKFYAWPYLPMPRPNQICFFYSKRNDSVFRLWSLPDAKTLAIVSESKTVTKDWALTKFWADAFFIDAKPGSKGQFHKAIRHTSKQFHGVQVDLESESEFLSANREKLIKAGCKQVDASFADAFDFSKVTVNKVVNSKAACVDKLSLDHFRQTEAGNRNVGT